MSRGDRKRCYQLKGDQKIFRLGVRNIFHPSTSDCCRHMMWCVPPWCCVRKRCWWTGHVQMCQPGAAQTAAGHLYISSFWDEAGRMSNNIFSNLNRHCKPHSACLCSCRAPPLCVRPALICIHQTQNCSVWLSKPALKSTLAKDKKHTEHPTEILTEKAIGFAFHANTGRTENRIFLFSETFWYFKISFVPNLDAELQFCIANKEGTKSNPKDLSVLNGHSATKLLFQNKSSVSNMVNHKLMENVKWIIKEELLSVSWMETWYFAINHALFVFLMKINV